MSLLHLTDHFSFLLNVVAADNIYLERNKAGLKGQGRQFSSAVFIAVPSDFCALKEGNRH